MAIVRQYQMIARPGESAAVRAIIGKLQAALHALPGCTGTELLQDIDRPERFVLTQRWTDVEAHKAGAAQLPRDEIVMPMIGLLEGLPDGAYLAAPGES